MEYVIDRAAAPPELDAPWEDPAWQKAAEGVIAAFTPKSTFKPDVRFRMLYDDKGLYGMYRVADRYVRSVSDEDLQMVCFDSCVEFFVKPAVGKGYLNFEFSCGGVMLASHVLDHRRYPGGFVNCHLLTREQCRKVNRFSTLPRVNEPERVGDRVWRVAFFIPFTLFAEEFGQEVPRSGDVWTANFYKCGDRTSHPHWGMWHPLPVSNFHMPEHFAGLRFA